MAVYSQINVDDVFSRIVEPNLFANNILQAGLTYTTRYNVNDAGRIIIHKLGVNTVTAGKPGSDLSTIETPDSLLTFFYSNNFQRSEKIYGVQSSAVGINLIDEKFSLVIQEIADGFQRTGMGVLKDGSTDIGDTTPITTTNVKEKFLDMKEALTNNKAKSVNIVAIVSPSVFNAILKANGDDFTPAANDERQRTGMVGTYFGVPIIEANNLDNATQSYEDNAGVTQSTDLTDVEIFMYDFNAFAVGFNFDNARLIDSELFFGSLAQAEQNAGYLVTNAERALVKTFV